MTSIEEYTGRYNNCLVKIAEDLEALLEDHCKKLARIDRISARAKSINRFIVKSQKRDDKGNLKYDEPLDEIQDQIGARIVTFYLEDVQEVEAHIRQYFRAVESQYLIPESESEFGYFGRHFIFFLPSDITSQYDENLVPKFFELQIKTLFQHAWAESNHDLAYKPPVPMSSQQRRLIAFTAAQAWGADDVFEKLRAEIDGMPIIDTQSISDYKGEVKIFPGDLNCGIWDIFDKDEFDKTENCQIISLQQLVSTKNQLEDSRFLAGKKSDPRETAFEFMKLAADGKGKRRSPITVVEHHDEMFYIIDGNATAQVLMLLEWPDVPVEVRTTDGI